jgi:hypothetical protein
MKQRPSANNAVAPTVAAPKRIDAARSSRVPQPVTTTTAPPPQQEPAEISEEEIRLRAYQIWERAGKPAGHDHEHWLQAQRELQAMAQTC